MNKCLQYQEVKRKKVNCRFDRVCLINGIEWLLWLPLSIDACYLRWINRQRFSLCWSLTNPFNCFAIFKSACGFGQLYYGPVVTMIKGRRYAIISGLIIFCYWFCCCMFCWNANASHGNPGPALIQALVCQAQRIAAFGGHSGGPIWKVKCQWPRVSVLHYEWFFFILVSIVGTLVLASYFIYVFLGTYISPRF